MLALLCGSPGASAQSLARPGWAGSGMEAETWWPHAVLCEVEPDSLATLGDPAEGATLRRLTLRLDDLRTLGIDALLLEDLEDLGNLKHDSNQHLESETPAARAPAEAAAHAASSAVAIDPRYGTLDDFDDLVREAARRGLRILVGLRPGAQGTALTDDARLWLNHGVTGLSLERDDPEAVRAIRSVLRGYVGARVLIAGKPDFRNLPFQPRNAPSSTSGERSAFRNTAVARADQPDLARIALPSLNNGAMPMRLALAHAQAPPSGRGPVPLLSADATKANPAAARALTTALLGSGGAVLLRADDVDLAHASDAAGQSSSFAWYRLWSGLHRGNAALRSGKDLLLDHDAEGVLVRVRQPPAGGAPIVILCNLTNSPITLSLVGEVANLRLRGSFLRTLARSDGGMGAMPLRAITLPPFAVYAGELSR